MTLKLIFIRNIKQVFFAFLLFMAAFMAAGIKSQAAFPSDMEKKPVECYPLYEAPEEIEFFSDAALTHWKGNVNKGGLLLMAVKAGDHAIYGSFVKDGQPETGWFDLGNFVADPDYEDEYYTVRSRMTVYTDSSMDETLCSIKKYSGVIVIGQEGDSAQVICQKKNTYATGWMSDDDLTNTLIYDGREKQTLADGIYLFRGGYQDNNYGGVSLIKQPDLLKKEAFTWELIHDSEDQYYIREPGSGKYLSVSTGDGGLSFTVSRTGQPDRVNGLFHLERATGSYTIKNLRSSLYLALDEGGKLTLYRYRYGDQVCWRISASEKTVDTGSPMVFTQYDPLWCGTAYGSEGCMGTAGCGILATVNAVYALSGQYMDVMELADYAVEEGYRIIGSGTDEGIFKAACKRFGAKYNFTWDGSGGSIRQLIKKLDQGDTAVVHVQGHYVSVVAYDRSKKKFLLLDSNYLPKRDDTAFGDWIPAGRLMTGALEAQKFFYFKLRDPLYPFSGVKSDKP